MRNMREMSRQVSYDILNVSNDISVLANGKELYQCKYANHSVNMKNLLECNKSYADSVASNEFYFLD